MPPTTGSLTLDQIVQAPLRACYNGLDMASENRQARAFSLFNKVYYDKRQGGPTGGPGPTKESDNYYYQPKMLQMGFKGKDGTEKKFEIPHLIYEDPLLLAPKEMTVDFSIAIDGFRIDPNDSSNMLIDAAVDASSGEAGGKGTMGIKMTFEKSVPSGIAQTHKFYTNAFTKQYQQFIDKQGADDDDEIASTVADEDALAKIRQAETLSKQLITCEAEITELREKVMLIETGDADNVSIQAKKLAYDAGLAIGRSKANMIKFKLNALIRDLKVGTRLGAHDIQEDGSVREQTTTQKHTLTSIEAVRTSLRADIDVTTLGNLVAALNNDLTKFSDSAYRGKTRTDLTTAMTAITDVYTADDSADLTKLYGDLSHVLEEVSEFVEVTFDLVEL
jgi:hypothetical protein